MANILSSSNPYYSIEALIGCQKKVFAGGENAQTSRLPKVQTHNLSGDCHVDFMQRRSYQNDTQGEQGLFDLKECDAQKSLAGMATKGHRRKAYSNGNKQLPEYGMYKKSAN